MNLPRPALMSFNDTPVTDHNRTQIGESVTRIGRSLRTARGSLKTSYIADKTTFDVSWSMLPENDEDTVDGYMGARSIIEFYEDTPGSFTLKLFESDYEEESGSGESGEEGVRVYEVVFTSMDYSIQKRWDRYYYSVSIELEEV